MCGYTRLTYTEYIIDLNFNRINTFVVKSPTTRHHPHPNEGEYAVKTHTHIYIGNMKNTEG